ncbi:MAG: serpin family protein [Candidatus Eiseniibacteriota bacterium]
MRRASVAILSGFLLAGCNDSPKQEPRAAAGAAPPAVERAPLVENLDFAVSLLQHAALSPRGNAVLCPHGWSETLGLLAEGARGRTRDELEHALRRAPAESAASFPAVGWTSRTCAWVGERLRLEPAFESVASTRYHARLERGLDPEEMKSWASEGLEMPVASLIDWSVDVLTAIVVVNVNRFAGTWRTPFPLEGTADAPFRRAAGDSVSVQLMHASPTATYLESDEWQVVRLPYDNPDLCAVVLLPRSGEPPVDVLIRTGARPIREILDAGRERAVEVALPRFDFLDAIHGRPMLEAVGIRDAWIPRTADFLGISPDTLFLGRAQQAVSLRVDETGTKAEAITRVEVRALGYVSGPDDAPPVLRADHPFAFLVVHRPSRAVLFAAVVGDPTESALPGTVAARAAD